MMRILELILLILLLLFAAFTAASEIAFIASSRFKLKRLAQEGSKTAKLVLNILKMPERFLGTILVTNNVVDTLIAALVTAIIISLIGARGRGVIIATVIASFLIIVFEVAAKTLATRHSERLALNLARPIRALILIFSPIVKVFAILTNFIVSLVGSRPQGVPSLVTEEEIKALIEMGGEKGAIHKDKLRMLSKVFDFSEREVRNVMTPKEDMISIDADASLDDIIDKILEHGYSRLPVYKDSPDNIIGLINAKDILNTLFNKGLIVLQDIIYPATTVNESKKVTDLLREFQKGHTHLAIVIDDKGWVKGIVTLEDILEEIVGEIEDEYDVRASYYKKLHF